MGKDNEGEKLVMTSNQPSQLGKFPKSLSRFFDPWLVLLLGGGLLIAHPKTAEAKPLPPPPIFDNIPPSQPSAPPSSDPDRETSSPANQAPPNRDLEFEASPSSVRSSPRTRRYSPTGYMYEVDVYGDSPLLLAQVQRVVPDAFVRRRESVIQAGAFVEQSYAVDRVRLLEAQGIKSHIRAVAAKTANSSTLTRSSPISASSDSLRLASDAPTAPSQPLSWLTSNPKAPSQPLSWPTSTPTTPSEPTPVTSEPPPVTPSSRIRSSYYYVVIPGARENLADMASEVIRLGMNREAVQQREGLRGSHLAIGPFEKRALAERWSNYFRSAGMDARVYFGR